MSDEIKGIFCFVNELWSLKDRLSKAKREQRERIAAYLLEIRACVSEVLVRLRANNYPAGCCAEMEEYAFQLPDILKGVIDKEKTEDLKNELMAAHRLERAYSKVNDPATREEKLVPLEEATGVLKALANYLKAK